MSISSVSVRFTMGFLAVCYLCTALCGVVGTVVEQSCEQSPEACVDPESLLQFDAKKRVASGWELSYQAGSTVQGARLGGSEILHLQSHDGKLFAANGYWHDSNNCYYPRMSYFACFRSSAWAQILRLDSPTGRWVQDLALGGQHLRAELLQSITLTTDRNGATLDPPVSLLVAGAFDSTSPSNPVDLWTRNDRTGSWTRQRMSRLSGSVRAMTTHRDTVTGVDRVFVSSDGGVLSGAWNPSSRSIVWGSALEVRGFEVRPLGFAEANSILYVSAGRDIYRRQDGRSATWQRALRMSGSVSSTHLEAIGGIRGITSVPTPGTSTGRESLLFVWAATSQNQGCVQRLDPDANGGLAGPQQEVCLGELMSTYYDTNVYYTIGGYNKALPVYNPATGGTDHLIGFEARVDCNRLPCALRGSGGHGGRNSAYYAGAVFFIRRGAGDYVINEVGGLNSATERTPLVATRAYAVSPFPGEDSVYFGGFDANGVASTDRAWVYRADLGSALSIDASSTTTTTTSTTSTTTTTTTTTSTTTTTTSTTTTTTSTTTPAPSATTPAPSATTTTPSTTTPAATCTDSYGSCGGWADDCTSTQWRDWMANYCCATCS